MDTLPDELVVLILRYLRPMDILRVRLVSRRYAPIASQFFPDTRYFFLRRNSLARLQGIANHHILCRTLRKVTFMVDVAPRFTDIAQWRRQAEGYCQGHDRAFQDAVAQEWLKHYSPRQNVEMSKSDMPGLFLSTGWERHLGMVREQDDLGDSSTFSQLRRTLRKLVNLSSISIGCFEGIHNDIMRQLYVTEHGQAWYCWNKTHSRVGDEPIASQFYAAAMEVSLPQIIDGHSSHANQSGLGTITGLHISSRGYASFNEVCREIAPCMGQSSLRLVAVDVRQRSALGPSREVTFNERAEGITDMSAVLGSITNLEQLILIANWDRKLLSEDIFRHELWPNLSLLCIGEIDIHQTSFQDFLQSHATKLKALEISDANMRNRSARRLWSKLINFLMTQMQLSSFKTDGFLTENRVLSIDLGGYWTAPSGTMVSVELIVQYLVVGISNMQELDQCNILNLGHDLCLADLESAVYEA